MAGIRPLYLAVRQLEEEVGSEDSHAGVLSVAGLQILKMERTHRVGVDE